MDGYHADADAQLQYYVRTYITNNRHNLGEDFLSKKSQKKKKKKETVYGPARSYIILLYIH